MSNYNKPNKPQPVNKVDNTKRVTSTKIPNPLAEQLSINDVVFPLDKTPIENWVSYNNKVYGNSVEPLTASEKRVGEAVESKTVEPKAVKYKPKKDQWKYESWGDQQIAKAPKMSAKKSWQIIKQSMDKDELAEWYKAHPEDKPAEYKPYKPDPIISAMYSKIFGEDF